MLWIFTSFKHVYHSVVLQLYREGVWMILGDELLRSVLVLLCIYGSEFQNVYQSINTMSSYFELICCAPIQ